MPDELEGKPINPWQRLWFETLAANMAPDVGAANRDLIDALAEAQALAMELLEDGSSPITKGELAHAVTLQAMLTQRALMLALTALSDAVAPPEE